MAWKIIFTCMQLLALSSALHNFLPDFNFDKDLVELACDAAQALSDYDPSKVNFYLWTRSNNGDFEYVVIKNGDFSSLELTAFDGALKTYVFIHGINENGTQKWILESKTKILNLEDANIISIEASPLIRGPAYYFPKAVCNAYKVADCAASFFNWLVEKTELTASKIHIIGHEIGAHIAGKIAEKTEGIISRITGLDPTHSKIWELVSNWRLNKQQAEFVDNIHTQMCSVIGLCSGISLPIGHVDFFPNGGANQLGCSLFGFDTCCTRRSVEYWVESIIPDKETFQSWPCAGGWEAFFKGSCFDCAEGCLDMGFHLHTALRGNFYLSTHKEAPFAQGSLQLSLDLNVE